MDSSAIQPGQASEPRLVAPAWHTLALLLLLLAFAWTSDRYGRALAERGRILLYVFLIAAELVLLAFLAFGLRKGIALRDIVGGGWTGQKALFDLVIAAVFWLLATLALGLVRRIIGLATPEELAKTKESLAYLSPSGAAELFVWVALSVTVGVVEEIVFRGYLMRQFGALARSAAAGLLLQGILFGVAHGYQSARQMIVFAAYGVLFGLLATWRRSLRPGMIAHAWQDIFSGFLLRS